MTLVYAAYLHCACGAGMAYDGLGFSGAFNGYWECSEVLLGMPAGDGPHTQPMSFLSFSVIAEGDPMANGATTRPAGE